MSSSRDILQKLLRSPKPRSRTDLLNKREYNLLASTTFEQFLAENFNEDQLEKLCAAEWEQLQLHFSEVEKKADRNLRKLRAKAKRPNGSPRVRVRNVPAPTASASSILRSVVPETVAEPAQENIENAIEQQEGSRDGEGVEPQVEELNVTLERVDLSRSMAPRELLLDEPVPVPFPEPTELDLGPPGDAAAFFGSNDAMPMDNPQVREQLLHEFPSLRKPQIDRRYEDLDDELDSRLMPPPNVPASESGISSSTPIATDPQLRRRVLGAIDLSFIKYPTPGTVDTLLRSDNTTDSANVDIGLTPSVETVAPEISSIPQPETEEQNSTTVDSALPTSTEMESILLQEPTPVEPVTELLPEPVSELQPPSSPREPQPSVLVQIPSSTSSSSSDHPNPPSRRPGRNRSRRVPEYNNSNLVIRFQARTTFPLALADDFSMFETDRQLIERLLQQRAARDAADFVVQRQVPQAGEDQQASLRDLSGVPYADISSIRELPSATGAQLYPIPERPQAEEREEGRKSMPELPRRMTMGDGLELSGMSAGGKGPVDSMVELVQVPVVDAPNLEPPQIVISGSAEEEQHPKILTTEPTVVEKPLEEIARNLPVLEVPIPAGDGQNPGDRPRKELEQLEFREDDEKIFVELLKLYLVINHAAKTTHHGTISMEHLQVLECAAPHSKLACARLFAKLLQLKKLALVETGVDERRRIRSVTVKG